MTQEYIIRMAIGMLLDMEQQQEKHQAGKSSD